MIAAIHLDEEGDWKRTKAAVLERNALQPRASQHGKAAEIGTPSTAAAPLPDQLEAAGNGTGQDRHAMAWLAALKRIAIVGN